MKLKYIVKIKHKKPVSFDNIKDAWDYIAQSCVTNKLKEKYIKVCTHVILEVDGLANYIKPNTKS